MRRHKSTKSIIILTVLLMAIGLIVIYAIGPQRANFLNAGLGEEVYGENSFFYHQLISVVLSLVVFIAAAKLPYDFIRKFAKHVLVLGMIACIVLMGLAAAHSSLASCQLGACRWYNLGSISFQPAELLKIGLVLYLAQLVAERKKEGKLETRDFLQPMAIVSAISLAFVVIVQKDLGTGVALIAIIVSILLMSGMSYKTFGIIIGVIGLLGVLSIVTSPHRMQRLMTFGGEDESDSYHIDNAILAIGTGGFFGVGIGNSVQATGYLPESINDSVFAVMGETFGFIGLVGVLGIFAGLLLTLLKVSIHLDLEKGLVVTGVFAWIATHVAVNVAAMTGLIPLTGITLPLLSYGGTSMLFISAALGLCLQLSCYTNREVRKDESISSGRGLGRTYHSGRRGSA